MLTTEFIDRPERKVLFYCFSCSGKISSFLAAAIVRLRRQSERLRYKTVKDCNRIRVEIKSDMTRIDIGEVSDETSIRPEWVKQFVYSTRRPSTSISIDLNTPQYTTHIRDKKKKKNTVFKSQPTTWNSLQHLINSLLRTLHCSDYYRIDLKRYSEESQLVGCLCWWRCVVQNVNVVHLNINMG